MQQLENNLATLMSLLIFLFGVTTDLKYIIEVIIIIVYEETTFLRELHNNLHLQKTRRWTDLTTYFCSNVTFNVTVKRNHYKRGERYETLHEDDN